MHSHECPDCRDSWKHEDETCPYPRYTTWHETGTRDYTLPEYPCPTHQWDDYSQVYTSESLIINPNSESGAAKSKED